MQPEDEAQTPQSREFAALKADIDKGIADLAAGRVTDVNFRRIIKLGRKLLAARLRSV
jgi:antitoxin ParD1/3/4